MAELSPNARTVLERRYLVRDEAGVAVAESPTELFRRVARVVAAVDAAYGEDPARSEERFFQLMDRLEFLPNSPTLMNAGRELGQLAACFVVPVGDSMGEIFDAVKWAAVIQMTGGGTGFAFSRLRPSGDLVASTRKAASGPLPFMDVFNSATDAIKQGGTRRGANMGVLRVDHPDILEFIAAKLDPARLRNFNISVAATDEFMSAVAAGASYALRNPRTGEPVRTLPARKVFDLMVNSAWASGDPGILFIDRINAAHPTPSLGAIESTNPCVTGDTRVWVEDAGMVPIRELVGKQPRIATWNDHQGLTFQRASQVVATGLRPVVRLRTLEGFELRLTADHRVTTDQGDLAASELETGARIRLAHRPPVAPARDTHDAGLGEVAGWLTGDGHFTQHEAGKPTVVLGFYGSDKLDAAPRLLAHVQRLVGDDRLGLDVVEARNMSLVRSSRLRTELARRGIDTAAKHGAPEIMWRGSDDLVAGYLRGLFSADGSVQGRLEKGVSVRLASNELQLLRDVQLLLLRLGVRSTIYANRRTEGVGVLPDGRGGLREYPRAAQHELVVARSSLRAFAETVGFLIAAKSDRLDAIFAEHRRGPYAAGEFVTVTEIVPDGEDEVFDLSEPVTSHFFANGLLVHNCGEQPLLPFESCVLGSINVARFVVDGGGGTFDWARLGRAAHDAVHFLDNVIDANQYPLPQIERITKLNRKIGLGPMGFADALIRMGVAYDEPRALELAEELATFLERASLDASAELARRRGPFAGFETSRWADEGSPPLRNATTTTVAPTGTISIIAGCSSGIEPLFAVSYTRNVLDGDRLTEINPELRRRAEERGLWTDALAAELARRGRARGLDAVPEDLQRLFVTAHDLPPEVHVRMQAAFQRRVHAAVSKTVNFPNDARPEDIAQVYRLAYDLGCKGVTVYRDRSQTEQVLVFGDETDAKAPTGEPCPECGSELHGNRRCVACLHCGWSRCG